MKTKADDLINGLPGEALVRRGLDDYASDLHTPAACLVRIAHPRLFRCGLLPPPAEAVDEAELELYRLLRQEGGDAYARYNALLGELVSFEMALDRRLRATTAPVVT